MPGTRDHPAHLADFRITSTAEIQGIIQRLLEDRTLVTLSGPQGESYITMLWQADAANQSLSFSAEDGDGRLDALLEGGEISVVAYLDSIKVQFDLDGVLQVSAPRGRTLRANWPQTVYRFQRRDAFRVSPLNTHTPVAKLYHPSAPHMPLSLRVLDVSLSGVALFLPDNVPMIPAGVKIAHCRLELDDVNAIEVSLVVHHVTAIHPQTQGVRLGCELLDMDGTDRTLGNYINQTQKRRALLALERR
jgi:c-di-GMP-binding flagellar brake protein YcgR